MSSRVVFYCPDTHIVYDGTTPYKSGVGGGITARIRMARALQRLGHTVTMVVNCPVQRRMDGVLYLPLQNNREIESDVFIMNTSGGDYDLQSVNSLEISADMRIVWMSGTDVPKGFHDISYDFVYAKSNFLRQVALSGWGVPVTKIFVAYNGFDEELFKQENGFQKNRDPFRLIYLSHPSKGLDAAINVLGRLREVDSRYHLLVFGGPELWGHQKLKIPEVDGLIYRGLVGQRDLALELMQSTFSICLQSREEPFGMVITESMRAGTIVVASAVGAYQELVRDGVNGFLIEGDHCSADVHHRASTLILSLAECPTSLAEIRRNAQSVIWDSDTMAKVWSGHWGYLGHNSDFSDQRSMPNQLKVCDQCEGEALLLEDGYHCVDCGVYSPGPYGSTHNQKQLHLGQFEI